MARGYHNGQCSEYLHFLASKRSRSDHNSQVCQSASAILLSSQHAKRPEGQSSLAASPRTSGLKLGLQGDTADHSASFFFQGKKWIYLDSEGSTLHRQSMGHRRGRVVKFGVVSFYRLFLLRVLMSHRRNNSVRDK